MDDVKIIDSPKERPGDIIRRVAKLHEQSRFGEAVPLLEESLLRNPGSSELHNAQGVMFAGMGRDQDAIRCYKQALFLNPTAPGIWTNLGNAFARLKNYRSALLCQHRAVELSSKETLLYHNLGVTQAACGDHVAAIMAFSRALTIDPNHHKARWDRARSYLHLGNYHEGWADYEVRLISGQTPFRPVPGTKWDGAPYGGKRLLVLVEQGFGDIFWAARYLPWAKALGGHLIVECQPETLPVIRAMGIADQLIVKGEALPPAEFHCHYCSLPGVYGQSMPGIPSAPYITVTPDRLARLAPLFVAPSPVLKVGIVWSGSVTFKKNHERAQPLPRFLEAFAMPGIQLYSLQKGPREQELLQCSSGTQVVNLSPHLGDFLDTAAAIAHLDLIIMTDSAVAHLAGAMGKPVWLLLGAEAHWLWLLQRSDSPWYPSLKLYRPRAEGDWAHVFDTAAADLLARSSLIPTATP